MMPQSVIVAFPEATELAPAKDWMLTTEAFELLLNHLDNDRDEAARKYVSLYTKLVRYFDWLASSMPAWHADETMTRIARKIEKGAVITNFQGFMFGIARKVAIEALKEREKEQRALAYLSQAGSDQPDLEQEYLLARLEAGLLKLSPRGRELLLAYYATSDDKHMEIRRKLAAREGISVTALRVRVHRLKMMLQTYLEPDLDSELQAEPAALHGTHDAPRLSRANLYAI